MMVDYALPSSKHSIKFYIFTNIYLKEQQVKELLVILYSKVNVPSISFLPHEQWVWKKDAKVNCVIYAAQDAQGSGWVKGRGEKAGRKEVNTDALCQGWLYHRQSMHFSTQMELPSGKMAIRSFSCDAIRKTAIVFNSKSNPPTEQNPIALYFPPVIQLWIQSKEGENWRKLRSASRKLHLEAQSGKLPWKSWEVTYVVAEFKRWSLS